MLKEQITFDFALVVVFAMFTRALAQFPPQLDGADIDGTNGFTVYGIDTEELGRRVAGLGDVNNDGIDDVASGGPGVLFPPFDCGWPGECQSCDATPGAVHVFFGRNDIGGDGEWSTADLDGTNGFRISGILPNHSASRPQAAGDFNNDGVDDFLMVASAASPDGVSLAGEAYMIYGHAGLGDQGSFDLTSLNGENGFRIPGTFHWGALSKLASLGDFNGDGVDDIALGASGASPNGLANAGQVYVLYGGKGIGKTGTFAVPDSITPDLGVIFNGQHSEHGLSRIAGIGDFNGDEINDVLMVASLAYSQPQARGQGYVIYGGLNSTESGVFDLSTLDGIDGFVINGPASIPGENTDTKTGESIAGVGDLNHDGFADIGISVNIPPPGDWLGVIFGGPNVAPDGLFFVEDLNGKNGFKVFRSDQGASRAVGTPAGDLNNDGIDDLMATVDWPVVIFGAPDVGSDGSIGSGPSEFDGAHVFYYPGGKTQANAGDVNADGIGDIMVGFGYEVEDCNVGKMRVIFGRRMGDVDLDADVDWNDYAGFISCVGESSTEELPEQCYTFDFDHDGVIDKHDFGAFQRTFATLP